MTFACDTNGAQYITRDSERVSTMKFVRAAKTLRQDLGTRPREAF